ncbi:hypothetical protein Syun_014963 [Stephania yunnanensis]|uniref:DEAD/DEAH-box helicase domain-containing protein n=1 Tax=Stephania yunnanensis TaxID=152371 RepID=A0AAP0JM15_9MAGN
METSIGGNDALKVSRGLPYLINLSAVKLSVSFEHSDFPCFVVVMMPDVGKVELPYCLRPVKEQTFDQSECFAGCFLSDINMVISAPTGSGKTVLFKLCIPRLLSRIKDGGLSFFSDIGLLLIDEVHLLNDQRGASLEAIVNNLKMLARNPEMNSCALARIRFIAVSATIPYVEDLGKFTLASTA